MTDETTVDAELGEALYENEAQFAQHIAAAIAAQLQDGERPAHRDAHPRAHGCVRAEFRVDDDVPPNLAQGVFVPSRSYPAWIRFSNGNPDATRHDAEGDVRGMAIKLLGVPGEKLLPDERGAQTQDFVLMSHPVFFSDDPRRYLDLVQVTGIKNPLKKKLKEFLALGLTGALIAHKATSLKIASPLETRYWSTVPYRLGDPPHKQAVKFSARPAGPPMATIPGNPAPQFLRDTMVRQLAAGEARFDFLIQPRRADMSVENSMVEWKEADAPFVKVATITIPRQQFGTPERDQFGENLSFTPWHALPQHRPLGAVNRIRRLVYQTISRLRHDLNKAPRQEPSS